MQPLNDIHRQLLSGFPGPRIPAITQMQEKAIETVKRRVSLAKKEIELNNI